MKLAEQLAGRAFGRLVVVEVYSNGRRGMCRCTCACGTETNIRADLLLKGSTTSCGCFQKEVSSRVHTTHGCTGTSTYEAWHSMLARCERETCPEYKLYGARGITVCERWHRFENFLEDMGEKPREELSLDRHPDYNGNYEPGNCRWATSDEQANNKRTSRRLVLNGEEHTLKQWADLLHVPPTTIHSRLSRGWPLERALTPHTI